MSGGTWAKQREKYKMVTRCKLLIWDVLFDPRVLSTGYYCHSPLSQYLLPSEAGLSPSQWLCVSSSQLSDHNLRAIATLSTGSRSDKYQPQLSPPSANTHGCCQTNRVCYKYKSEMFCPIEMANSLFYSSEYFWYLNIPVKYCYRIGHGRFNCCLWCVTFPISYSRFYLVSHSSGHYCFLSKRISFLSVIMADKTPTKLWFSL